MLSKKRSDKSLSYRCLVPICYTWVEAVHLQLTESRDVEERGHDADWDDVVPCWPPVQGHDHHILST